MVEDKIYKTKAIMERLSINSMSIESKNFYSTNMKEISSMAELLKKKADTFLQLLLKIPKRLLFSCRKKSLAQSYLSSTILSLNKLFRK